MIYSDHPATPCILFVEADPRARRFARAALEADGWSVLAARDSLEALALAADYPGSIDLLVADDSVRQGHNGPELASCFGVLRPETAVLHASAHPAGAPRPRPFIGKRLARTVAAACGLPA